MNTQNSKQTKSRQASNYGYETTLSYAEAWEIVGGLSNPSKMPGFAYGLPAEECPTGSKLAKVEGTPCHDCQAKKGRYPLPNVQEAQYRRLATLTDPRWVEAFITLLGHISRGQLYYFRWHDSGDVMSFEHLLNIFAIAWALPHVRFWLPTQERRLLKIVVLCHIPVPPNIAIRPSETQVDVEEISQNWGFPGSSVHTGERPEESHQCPCHTQDNKCGPCRACWDPQVKWVTYEKV